ncbi:hypothetical protein CEXT_726201 [Caerostris extrusa]|uniref:Uncharacterized protein n=1 Tax=Caerostris extrusa TaxID=172846 RepID=A0AAV4XDA4_CAEEX|nr:hypothetical protein CEXT_726201 [Caerostris extrusa]
MAQVEILGHRWLLFADFHSDEPMKGKEWKQEGTYPGMSCTPTPTPPFLAYLTLECVTLNDFRAAGWGWRAQN